MPQPEKELIANAKLPINNKNKNENEFSEYTREDEDEVIDDLVELIAGKDHETPVQALLKPVFRVIEENGDDYSGIAERLIEFYPDMGTDKVENILGKAIFLSELTGRFDGSD